MSYSKKYNFELCKNIGLIQNFVLNLIYDYLSNKHYFLVSKKYYISKKCICTGQ